MESNQLLLQFIEEDYGIKGSGRWYHSEEHDSLVLDYEKGIFYWNQKGIIGDTLHYLTNVRNMSFNDAKELLKAYNISDTYVYTVTAKNKEDIVVYPKLASVFWEYGKSDREYWYDRCITDSTIDRFQLGCYNGWYTIPFFVDGVFRQIQKRRNLPRKAITKWYRGLPNFLFNSDILRLTDEVYIVEGPDRAILLSQWGIPAVSHDGGSEYWGSDWFNYFLGQKKVIICYDFDSAGDFGSKKVAKNLGEYRCKIFNMWGLGDKGYDIVDFARDGGDKDQFLSLVKEKSKYLFELGK